jgi:hypothetical protein
LVAAYSISNSTIPYFMLVILRSYQPQSDDIPPGLYTSY